MAWIKKKDNFLPNFSKEQLKKLYNREKNGKAKLRLLAVIQRKEGKTLEAIAFNLQKPKTTIHDWLKRFSNETLNLLYDIKQPGKHQRLKEVQKKKLGLILSSSPEEQELPFVLWTTNLVQYIIFEKFNIEFKVRRVRDIIRELDFTLQVPRPEHKKANKVLQEEFKKKLKKKLNITLNLDSRSSVLMKPSSR